MRILFLHGPPAVGKLTIAREVSALTGWRLFHNHLAVDLALAVFDFGTPGFVALREQVWLAAFRRAREERLPGLIFTFAAERSVPQRFIDELFREFDVVPVELCAGDAEIERRLGFASRREHRKLVDLALYRRLRAAGTFASPVVPPGRLRVDTEALSPAAAAAHIAASLGPRSSPVAR